MKRRWIVVIAVLAVVAVVAGVTVWVRAHSAPSSRLAAAMELAPRSAVRLNWTDWTAVRQKVGMSTRAAADDVDGFLTKAFDKDLSSTSALVTSAPTLARSFGLSPANLDWELYAQGTDGAALLMGLPTDLGLAPLRSRLAKLGYRRPKAENGVWTLPEQGVGAGGDLTPELYNLRIDSDHHVLAAADDAGFLAGSASHARGPARDDDPVDQVVATMGDTVSASVYAGDFACRSLAMSQADPADQATASRLIAEAGKINPLDAFAMGNQPDGDIRVALAFESAEQARTNADSRAALASGAAPGQGGAFTDRFRLGRTTAKGDVVTMTLHPLPDTYVHSDLDTGPVLFASC